MKKFIYKRTKKIITFSGYGITTKHQQNKHLFNYKIPNALLQNWKHLFNEPVKAKVPPNTAQRRVMKWRKLRRSSLMVTVIGDKSYKKYTAASKMQKITHEHRNGRKGVKKAKTLISGIMKTHQATPYQTH